MRSGRVANQNRIVAEIEQARLFGQSSLRGLTFGDIAGDFGNADNLRLAGL